MDGPIGGQGVGLGLTDVVPKGLPRTTFPANSLSLDSVGMQRMSTARKISSISPEAYLEFEESAKEKHEYYNGEVYAMAGAAWEHIVINGNISSAISAGIVGKGCRAGSSDLKVHIEELNSFTYPDTVVVCGPPEFHGSRRDIITNPTLVVEVLSESTASFDRGMKFTLYRSLPSLREYVLIEQRYMQVDCYHRTANGDWVFSGYTNPDDIVQLRSLGIQIPLRQIYDGLDVPLAPQPPEDSR